MGKYSQMESGDTLINMNYLPQLEGIEDILQIDNPPSVFVNTVDEDGVVNTQIYGTWEGNLINPHDEEYSVFFESALAVDGFPHYVLDFVDSDDKIVFKYFTGEVSYDVIFEAPYPGIRMESFRLQKGLNEWRLWVDSIYLGSFVNDAIQYIGKVYPINITIANLTMTPLRTRDLVEDNVKLTYDLLGSTNSYSQFITSTSAAVGEVDFGFETQSVTFINDGVTTDTLYVSTSNTFPATNTIVRFGGEGFTKRMKTNKLYFKVGNVPLAGKKIRIEGY